MRKFVKGTRLAKRREIVRAFSESTRVAITPDGWKICLRDRDKNELYNPDSDPREKLNLYETDKGKDVIGRLTGEIHRWQETVADGIKV